MEAETFDKVLGIVNNVNFIKERREEFESVFYGPVKSMIEIYKDIFREGYDVMTIVNLMVEHSRGLYDRGKMGELLDELEKL
jgi:hypothetical protein